MEQESSKLMTPFDCQTIPQWIYLLKLILPYTPVRYQHTLAVFIRFQEMQLTMKHFNGFGRKRQFDNILNDVKPYMDPNTQEMMEQMESMMSMMEMMHTMQDFHENTSDSSSQSQGFNPMDILSGFTGGDLSSIFNMKGNSEHE